MEVAFYQLMSTSLEKTLAKLLEKVYESSQKAVVLLDSQERLEHLNSYLWTYSTAAFLPHGSPQDASLIAERQPIWLTTEFENPNQAQVIVVMTGETLKFEDNSFQRGLDLFDGNDSSFLLLTVIHPDKLSHPRASEAFDLLKKVRLPSLPHRSPLVSFWEAQLVDA